MHKSFSYEFVGDKSPYPTYIYIYIYKDVIKKKIYQGYIIHNPSLIKKKKIFLENIKKNLIKKGK